MPDAAHLISPVALSSNCLSHVVSGSPIFVARAVSFTISAGLSRMCTAAVVFNAGFVFGMHRSVIRRVIEVNAFFDCALRSARATEISMSAANRGAKKRARGAYFTPAWLVEAILPEIITRMSHVGYKAKVLEPMCGDGAIVKVAERWFETVHAVDLKPQGAMRDRLKDDHADVYPADFFKWPPMYVDGYDLVWSNPDFSVAEECVTRALKILRPGGAVVMLLRNGFLGSQGRGAWLRANTPSQYPTPRRPSFGGGSDNCDYSWFVWQPGTKPTIRMLETENEK